MTILGSERERKRKREREREGKREGGGKREGEGGKERGREREGERERKRERSNLLVPTTQQAVQLETTNIQTESNCYHSSDTTTTG